MAGVIAGAVFLFVGVVWMVVRSGRAEVLVARLRAAEGAERETLIMQLNLARGDAVSAMIAAFADPAAEPGFRADLLDLLFKRNLRRADERIAAVMVRALDDPEQVVRRAAVRDYAVYMGSRDQLALLDHVADPDPEVRRQVYLLLSAGGRWGPTGLWDLISGDDSKEAKARLLGDVIRQAAEETDPEFRLLARAVIGREIAARCEKAIEAVQTSDLAAAEDLLRGAMELDPQNRRAKIRYVRHFLGIGDREKAVRLADEYGALIRIPHLSGAPVIDGDPTDDAWREAFASDRFFLANSAWVARRTEGRSELRVGHRDGKVYIAVLGYEDDLSELVVKHAGRDSDTWLDDCVELFFDPVNSEKAVYQFVINANGSCFDTRHTEGKQANFESVSAAGVFLDRGYWAVEFAVAASALGGQTIAAESVWGMNIMRTRIGPASEQGAWWPTFGSSLNFNLHPLAVFEGVEATPQP